MYTSHKVFILLIGIIFGVIAFIFDLPYDIIASDVATFVSIAIAVYMAALALPLGEYMSEYMKAADKIIKTKTRMGVLCKYLKNALIVGILSIIIGNISILMRQKMLDYQDKYIPDYIQLMYKIISSFGFALFSINCIFLWIIFKYIISSVINGNNLKK